MMLQPHSLRTRLLVYLGVAIALVAAVQAAVAYRTALAEADAVFDYHMQQTALSLRGGLPFEHGADEPEHDEENFDFVVQIWSADGQQIYRSARRAELPERAVLGYSTVQARGSTYRVFSLQTPRQVIQVAQDMAVRRHMARTLALRTVAPMAWLVPLLLAETRARQARESRRPGGWWAARWLRCSACAGSWRSAAPMTWHPWPTSVRCPTRSARWCMN